MKTFYLIFSPFVILILLINFFGIIGGSIIYFIISFLFLIVTNKVTKKRVYYFMYLHLINILFTFIIKLEIGNNYFIRDEIIIQYKKQIRK